VNKALAKDNYNEAVRKASEAWYEGSDLKPQVTRFTKEFERKFIPVVIVHNGGLLVFLVQGLANDNWRLGYKWEF
jgi:hypothetical protein